MGEESTKSLQSIFEALEDPRVDRTKRHDLLAIIIIAILGVLCGAEGWVDIESFGTTKGAWLRTFLDLPRRTAIRTSVDLRSVTVQHRHEERSAN